MKKLLILTLFLLVNLCAAIAEGILPTSIELKVGETIDLKPYVTAALLANNQGSYSDYDVQWSYKGQNDSKYFTLDAQNGTITGVKPETGDGGDQMIVIDIGVQVFVYTKQTTLNGKQTIVKSGSSWVTVSWPDITKITVVNKDIYVGVGESKKLENLLKEAIQLTPANANAGHIQWDIADETIIGKMLVLGQNQGSSVSYIPGKIGTTTMTPKAVKKKNTYLTCNQSVTVHVVQPVTSIDFKSNISEFECNVGDDLTSYLNNLLEVSPTDATDKSVSWTLVPNDFTDPNNPPIQISANGTITAVREGSVRLQATSVSNPSVFARLTAHVHNTTTDFTIGKSTLNYTYSGSNIAIGEALSNNITILPAGFTEYGYLEVTSSKSSVVKITGSYLEGAPNITANVVGVGEAVITVKLTYTDYLASNGGSSVSKTVTKTFKVHVDPAVSLSFVGDDIPCIVGDDLTQFLEGRLRYEPTTLADKSHTWKVVSGNAVSVTNSGKTVKAVKAGTAVIRATLTAYPDKTVDVTLKVYNPATDFTVKQSVIEVKYSGSGKVDISQQLKNNISFLPQGCSVDDNDLFTMKSSNTKVLQQGYIELHDVGDYYVVGAGESTVTFTLKYTDRLKLYDDYPENQVRKTVTKTFKVRVLQQVTEIANNSQHESENCNVGDDLTAYLNSIIEVKPSNAADKSVKWTEPTNSSVLQITDNGTKIKALKAGDATIYATSVSNPNAKKAEIHIKVHKQANDFSIAKQSITVEYFDKPVDISTLIKDNIAIQPTGFTLINNFKITSSATDKVSVSGVVESNNLQVEASAKAVGTATITVSLNYIDYLKLYTTQGYKAQTVTKTFTVNVVAGKIPVSAITSSSPRDAEECNVGDDLTAHLSSLIQVTPANATDKSYTWSVVSGSAVSVSGGTISAVKAGTAVLKATSISTPSVGAEVKVTVHNPATDVQFADATLSLAYKGETINVSQQLQSNITYLPAGYESVGHATLTSSRPDDVINVNVVNQNALPPTLTAMVLGEGEATVTVIFDYVDYLAKYADKPESQYLKTVSKSFIINVVTTEIPVKAVTNSSPRSVEDCNLGDDLTAHLGSLIKVAPENATDKTLKWSIANGDAVSVTDGSIKAVKAGTATLTVTSVNNPEAVAQVKVTVHNPATDVQFAKEVITVEYKGEDVIVSQQLQDNISFQPNGYESIGHLAVTSSQPDKVINVNATVQGDLPSVKLTATAFGEGEATITVAFDYTDYLAMYADQPESQYLKTISKSFIVNVITTEIPVESITIATELADHNCLVGDDLTSYLNNMVRVRPENATDKSYTWSVTEGDAVSVANGQISAVKAGTATLTVTSVSNPEAKATIKVVVHNPARDITIARPAITVSYKGEPVRITDRVIDNITLQPEGYDEIESFSVTSSDESIVRIWDVGGAKEIHLMAEALSEGTATITVTLNYTDYLGQGTMTITKTFAVNVVTSLTPVTGISFSQASVGCTIGDDITTFLNSIIEVEPANATDKTYTWSITEGDAVVIDDDSKMTGVKAGTATLTVTSVSNPEVKATITVDVHDNARDIAIVKDVITVDYEGEAVDIGEKLKDNIILLPEGFGEIGAYTVTSSAPEVVSITEAKFNSIKAQALIPGTAVITVTLNYDDYLELSSQSGSGHYTVTKQFTVEVKQADVPQIASLTYPDELTISRFNDAVLVLTPDMDGAALGTKQIQIVIGESTNKGWGVAAIATAADASQLTWNLRGRFIGNYQYQVLLDGVPQKTESGKTSGMLHIPAEFPFHSGWDWISLYAVNQKTCTLTMKNGAIWLSPMDADGSTVLAIRSQTDFLQYDSEYGFFGTLN